MFSSGTRTHSAYSHQYDECGTRVISVHGLTLLTGQEAAEASNHSERSLHRRAYPAPSWLCAIGNCYGQYKACEKPQHHCLMGLNGWNMLASSSESTLIHKGGRAGFQCNLCIWDCGNARGMVQYAT